MKSNHKDLRDNLRDNLIPWGYRSAFAACFFNGVWIGCMIFLQTLGDVSIQAQSQPGIFRLSVGSALLLTMMQIPILLATVTLVLRQAPTSAIIGGTFYTLYIPINLISYYTYGRLAPMIHSEPLSSKEGALLIAGMIEIGHDFGIIGNLPILGYGLLGIAWCLLAPALWRRNGFWKITSGFLLVSGLLSFLGAVGSFIDIDWLTSCCFIGGIVSFPALALLGLALLQETQRNHAA